VEGPMTTSSAVTPIQSASRAYVCCISSQAPVEGPVG
jgi:hypothetical protein